jgi:hypothetical protein
MQAFGRNHVFFVPPRGRMISYDRQPLQRRFVKRRQMVIGFRLDVSHSALSS